MIRASGSVTNNIAEGYDRFYFQENTQFLRQSRGSFYNAKIIYTALRKMVKDRKLI